MPRITCYRCFYQFAPRRLRFKCLRHPGRDDVLGNQAFTTFPWRPQAWHFRPPRHALCPQCQRLTSYRICPSCRQDLPHYVGRVDQQIIAVCGCRTTGKTVYQWSLLHQLRELLSSSPATPVSAMFEDDESFRLFHRLNTHIRIRGQLPELTRADKMVQGKFEPIIVRLLRGPQRRRSVHHTNLIFYDHRGELIEELRTATYLRYLAHASAIVYLVDSHDTNYSARDGLTAIIQELRKELRLPLNRPLDKPLAVAISKAEESIFPHVFAQSGRESVIPDHTLGLDFWQRPKSWRTRSIKQTSDVCRNYLLDNMKQAQLVALAENSFRVVRYFGVSSLNGALTPENRILNSVTPLGVEHPIFWLLDQIS